MKNPSIRSNPICWLSNKPAERLHTPSLEQKAIIDSVLSGNSVLCASVAGSGKTTTVLSIAEAMQRSDLSNNRNPRPILMLTYSAKLKEDSRQRVGLHKLENLTVHSYHSFYHLSKEYPCKNDKQMKDILANDNQLRRIWDFEERSGVKRGNALELLVLMNSKIAHHCISPPSRKLWIGAIQSKCW